MKQYQSISDITEVADEFLYCPLSEKMIMQNHGVVWLCYKTSEYSFVKHEKVISGTLIDCEMFIKDNIASFERGEKTGYFGCINLS